MCKTCKTCFLGDTLVYQGNNSFKEIYNIPGVLVNKATEITELFFEKSSSFSVTSDHEVKTSKGFVSVSSLRLGSDILMFNGESDRIVGISKQEFIEPFLVYNLNQDIIEVERTRLIFKGCKSELD